MIKSGEINDLIVENLNDLVAVIDENYNFKYINESIHKRTLGYSNEDLIDTQVIPFIHFKDHKKILYEFDNSLQTGIEFTELRFKHKEGHFIWIESNGKKFVDKDGIKKFLVISRDITKRKIAEEKLSVSEERYRLISENSNDLIRVLDDRFEFEYINENVHKKLLGYTIKDLRGKTHLPFLHPEDTRNAIRSTVRNLKRGKGSYQARFKKKDGTYKWFEISGKYFFDSRGKKKILSIARDITERKITEEKLRQSEERFRLISQNADENLFILDMNLNLIYNDPDVPNILGYTHEEVYKLNLTDYNVASSLKLVLNAYKEELRNERKKLKDPNCIRIFEIEQIHKNGSIVNVETRYTFLRDVNGEPTGILGLSRNINKRKQAEQKLRESEEKYRFISETASDLIGVLNKKFKYEYINEQAFQKTLGYSKEDLLGKSALKFIHQDDLSKIAKSLFDGFKQGIGESELRFKHKNRSWIWIEAKGQTFTDSNGEMKAIIISRDITERKLAEEKLKESEMKYRKAYNRAKFYKDLFTHDMNNILAIITSSTELIPFYLTESKKSKDIKSLTTVVQNQVDRGAKLISNVNILSELEDEEIHTEPTEVCELMRSSMVLIEKAHNNGAVNIKVSCPENYIIVNANELLQHVFDNILINAIKYNENHNVEISINVSKTHVDGKEYNKFEFIDNGIGVSDDRKDIIFKRGNREMKGSKGMGIGLSLVKKIIKSYNGKIWVEDKVKGDFSKGSNFILLIPETTSH